VLRVFVNWVVVWGKIVLWDSTERTKVVTQRIVAVRRCRTVAILKATVSLASLKIAISKAVVTSALVQGIWSVWQQGPVLKWSIVAQMRTAWVRESASLNAVRSPVT